MGAAVGPGRPAPRGRGAKEGSVPRGAGGWLGKREPGLVGPGQGARPGSVALYALLGWAAAQRAFGRSGGAGNKASGQGSGWPRANGSER
jgi:hypothetical protein